MDSGLCSIVHAVSYRLRPSWRCNCSAETPGVEVLIRYAAQNHKCSGVRVLCSTVPAVTDVWRWQAAHSHTSRRLATGHASSLPQRGQTNPSGQRDANRYSVHA